MPKYSPSIEMTGAGDRRNKGCGIPSHGRPAMGAPRLRGGVERPSIQPVSQEELLAVLVVVTNPWQVAIGSLLPEASTTGTLAAAGEAPVPPDEADMWPYAVDRPDGGGNG